MILGDKLHILTVIIAVYVPVSFVLTYILAVVYGHVEPGFPYISDTGTTAPESCLFGQLLNLGALLAACIVYARYKQIHAAFAQTSSKGLLRANVVSLVFGLLSALGVSIVGNFQETNVIVVHLIGAFMAFGIGGLYCYVQTGMSFRTQALPGWSPITNTIRILLCVLVTLFFILTMAGSNLAMLSDDYFANHTLWTPSDPGYGEHLLSTISEWLMAILIVVYFVTFYKEFHKFRLTSPEVVFDFKPETEPTQMKTAEASNHYTKHSNGGVFP